MRKALLASLSSLLVASVLGQTSTGTSGSTSGGAVVLPAFDTFDSAYQIDWSVIFAANPPAAFSIPENTELGPCVCDLTFNQCDVNCKCDAVCSLTDIARFSSASKEGPVVTTVKTCMDPDLITVNQRGGMTVALVDNMLCVADDNNPSKGSYLFPPGSLTAAELSALTSSQIGLYEPTDPVFLQSAAEFQANTASTDTYYKIGSFVKAARQAADTTFYQTNGGLFAIPTAAADGSCSDSNYLRYALGDTRSCTRSTGSVQLSTLCATDLFSGTRYVANIQLGKTASAVPAQTAQYVAANITAVWQRAYAADGSGALLSSSTAIPAPVWNPVTNACDNVLQRVEYTFTYLEGGSITTDPAPLVTAYLTSLPTSNGAATGSGTIIQTFVTKWQASSHVGLTTVVRPKSGNPGYLLGLPVLSGVLKSKDILSLVNGVTTTTTVTAIAQDTRGLTLLPKTTAGLCSTSSADPVHSVLFGHDSKFSCYLSLTQAQLGSLCTTGLSSYFGNVSTSLGIWGNSDFQNVNQWITVEQSTPTFAGSWSLPLSTCSTLVTGINIEIATVDAGNVLNAQRRILKARVTYTTSTWVFRGETATKPEMFPVFASVSYVYVPISGLEVYTPTSPPLLPKFPNDLLYPLYIENAATNAAPTMVIGALAAAALASIMARL